MRNSCCSRADTDHNLLNASVYVITCDDLTAFMVCGFNILNIEYYCLKCRYRFPTGLMVFISRFVNGSAFLNLPIDVPKCAGKHRRKQAQR